MQTRSVICSSALLCAYSNVYIQISASAAWLLHALPSMVLPSVNSLIYVDDACKVYLVDGRFGVSLFLTPHWHITTAYVVNVLCPYFVPVACFCRQKHSVNSMPPQQDDPTALWQHRQHHLHHALLWIRTRCMNTEGTYWSYVVLLLCCCNVFHCTTSTTVSYASLSTL